MALHGSDWRLSPTWILKFRIKAEVGLGIHYGTHKYYYYCNDKYIDNLEKKRERKPGEIEDKKDAKHLNGLDKSSTFLTWGGNHKNQVSPKIELGLQSDILALNI